MHLIGEYFLKLVMFLAFLVAAYSFWSALAIDNANEDLRRLRASYAMVCVVSLSLIYYIKKSKEKLRHTLRMKRLAIRETLERNNPKLQESQVLEKLDKFQNEFELRYVFINTLVGLLVVLFVALAISIPEYSHIFQVLAGISVIFGLIRIA